MNKFKDKKEAARWIFAVLISFAITAFLAWYISNLYQEKGSLTCYFFHVWYSDSLNVVLFFFLTIILGSYVFVRHEERSDLKGTLLTFLVIALVYIFFVNIFGVSKQFDDVLIDGKSPSKFVYKHNIFLDMINGDTKLQEIPVENIETDINHYTIGSRRSRGSYNSYYVKFELDNEKYSSLETYALSVYIDKLIEYKDTILVEYYPHTGIIKSIDGIDKSDTQKLARYVGQIESDAKKEIQRQEQEAIEKEEEQRENEANEYKVLSNSIGRNFAEVQEELSLLNINPTFELIYISSQMYDINAIAYYNDDILYVVKDNLSEDLIAFPRLDAGMTREQIIEILTDAGFSYECDEFECDNCGKGRLHTKGHGTGEYIPKQHKVWFSVDK